MVFPVENASPWEITGIETEGLTPHPWLRNPATNELWLWKQVVANRAHRREHWAEKVNCEIARLLHVPAADVELARRDDEDGCLSRNIRPHAWTIHSGAELISAMNPGFDARANRPVGYTAHNVAQVLSGMDAPPTWSDPATPADLGAFDVFVGYLMLDALVGNGDRHARNWAILRPPAGGNALSPLFDNASGLGFDLPDDTCQQLLERPGGVRRWVEKGMARAWSSREGGSLTLVSLVEEAWGPCSASARQFWCLSLRQLSSAAVEAVLRDVPEMSEPTRTFALEVVQLNRERILRACVAS